MTDRLRKKIIIDKMMKYPDYAVPSRQYLYKLDEQQLNEEHERLQQIFRNRKLVRR